MGRAENRKWWIFIGASLMIFLVNIDATIVNLALATVARDLHTGLTQVQWMINSYLLTTMIFFIVGGRLADLVGPKYIFLIGTVFFGVASLIAGTAPNFTILIIGRLLQGVGFALTLGLALLMIANAFPKEQRGFILGLSVTITGLGQALGPTVGGLILEELNWHWIFLINIPFAVLSFIIILLFGGARQQKMEKHKIDYLGVLLLGFALTLLLFATTTLSHTEYNLKLLIAGFVGSFLFFVLFYWKEIKTKLPLVNFHLFKSRDYTLSILIRLLVMYSFGTFLFFIPLFLQNILGYSPLVAGLMLLVYSALFGITSPMSGIWCDQVSYKIPIVFAAVVFLLAFVLLACIGLQTPIAFVLLAFICFGISVGIIVPSTVNSTISSIPEASSGEGLGVFFTVAFVGISLGVALGGAQMHFVSVHHLMNAYPRIIAPIKGHELDLLRRVANGTQPAIRLKAFFGSGAYQALGKIAQQSFIKGLSSIMWLNVILALIMIGLSSALRKRTPESE